jgi:hypothetical protein
MDADIPVATNPGTPCAWGSGCDNLYSSGNAATIDIETVNDITYNWTSRYHPNGYYLRTREYIPGQVTDWIWNDVVGNSTTKLFDKNLFNNGNTYSYTVRAIPHNLVNVPLKDELISDVPFNGANMFKVVSSFKWSGPLEFVLEEGSAQDYELEITNGDDGLTTGYAYGYDPNDYQYWYDGPANPVPPDGPPPAGVSTSSSINTVDVVRVLNPKSGTTYGVGVIFGANLSPLCPHTIKVSVRQNGKEKYVIQATTTVTCDQFYNNDWIDYKYTDGQY